MGKPTRIFSEILAEETNFAKGIESMDVYLLWQHLRYDDVWNWNYSNGTNVNHEWQRENWNPIVLWNVDIVFAQVAIDAHYTKPDRRSTGRYGEQYSPSNFID